MSRISIDVTSEEHQRLKALAALRGKSIKEFVLDSTLGEAKASEVGAIDELLGILDRRIEQAKAEGVSRRTIDEVFAAACERKGIQLDG